MVLTVRDADGNLVRRLTGPTSSGFHRVAWDLRYAGTTPGRSSSGPMVLPGRYSITLAKHVNGEFASLGEPQTVEVVPLDNATLPAADRSAVLAFRRDLGELQRAVLGANAVINATLSELHAAKRAVFDATAASETLVERLRSLEIRLLDAQMLLMGDRTVSSRAELLPPSILDRVQRAVRAQFGTTAEVTTTHRRNYEIAAEEFGPVLENLRGLIEVELVELQEQLEDAGVPWTSGRGLPRWRSM